MSGQSHTSVLLCPGFLTLPAEETKTQGERIQAPVSTYLHSNLSPNKEKPSIFPLKLMILQGVTPFQSFLLPNILNVLDFPENLRFLTKGLNNHG